MEKLKPYDPLLMAFDGDKRAQDHLQFNQWLEENRPPEEHITDQEGIDFIKMVNRREKLKQLMRH